MKVWRPLQHCYQLFGRVVRVVAQQPRADGAHRVEPTGELDQAWIASNMPRPYFSSFAASARADTFANRRSRTSCRRPLKSLVPSAC